MKKSKRKTRDRSQFERECAQLDPQFEQAVAEGLTEDIHDWPMGGTVSKKRRKQRPKKVITDVVETQCLVLVDEYGTERANLSCFGGDGGSGGHVVVHLNDDRGRPRMSLQVDREGNPGICLFTSGNSPAVTVAVNGDRGVGISIADLDGKPCIEIGKPARGADPRGDAANIRVWDVHGRRSWAALE